MKTTSFRTCVVCRKKLMQDELIRITKVNDIWYVNPNNKYQGRSIYLENDPAHFDKFFKMAKRLNISSDNLEEIRRELEDICEKQINI